NPMRLFVMLFALQSLNVGASWRWYAMTDNDIYDSKTKFERVRDRLEMYLQKPEEAVGMRGRRIFWVKNSVNLRHFRKLMGSAKEKGVFDIRDTSYIRRLRLFRTLLLAGHYIDKDFQEAAMPSTYLP
ncbi:MAG: hypothetical protein V1735_07250, partial [Nanoarchaeota archaeon]